MSMDFEELDYQHSFIGDISLRKRRERRLHNELVYEVKQSEFKCIELLPRDDL